MRRLLIFLIIVVITLSFSEQNNAVEVYFSGRTQKSMPGISEFPGCSEPTEPFNCPGSSDCIALQFICDGIPHDCPNNYDEDPKLCNAYHRPAKDTIIKFLSVQYSNQGSPFIVYLFGMKAAQLFRKLPVMEAFEVIAKNLAVSQTINEFAERMEMTEIEENRLLVTIEKVSTGQVGSLPPFIRDSVTEGLSSLVDNLKKTHFVN